MINKRKFMLETRKKEVFILNFKCRRFHFILIQLEFRMGSADIVEETVSSDTGDAMCKGRLEGGR